MQHYTVQDILALRPCQPTEYRPDAGYPEPKLRRLFGARQSVTLLEICDDARVPIIDRQWVLHRLLPEQIVHEVVCRYAEHALDRERAAGRDPDPRSWAALEAKWQWLLGEISDDELKAAYKDAWGAVRAAVGTAGRTAAETAAEAAGWTTAWYAAQTAARAAASAAERRWQLAILRAMIEEMEDRAHQQGENP